MKRNISALIAGLLFGVGLAASHMVEPVKVLGFLDIFGRWDPSLLLVMFGAVAVTLVAFRLILRRRAPLFASQFYLPTRTAFDRPLIVGSAIFGIGWGLAGYCPGPGIAALGLGTREAPVFIIALAAGSFTHQWVTRRLSRRAIATF